MTKRSGAHWPSSSMPAIRAGRSCAGGSPISGATSVTTPPIGRSARAWGRAMPLSTSRRLRTFSARSRAAWRRIAFSTRIEGRFRRLLIEKPFGHDLASARALNQSLLKLVDEPQIYRIDHYLGKETVRNIMVARFANPMIEAVWNRRYVDHVQITAAEAVGVGRRGKFYDATGALRDMVPNHLFQLLAMVGMEPPNSFAASAIRAEKTKVVEAVRKLSPGEVRKDVVRGRYGAGRVGDEPRAAYSDEPDVDPKSRTETYVAMKLCLDTWRWSGVPFYLRTGKAMARRDTEIVLQFRPVPCALFRHGGATSLPTNRLVIRIQPDEGISFDFLAKLPGPAVETAPVSMDFRYADHFQLGKLTGYETLLYDMHDRRPDPVPARRRDRSGLGGRAADPRCLEPRPRPASELQGGEQWAGSGRRVARPRRPRLAFARNMSPGEPPAEAIRLLVSDIDGTLVRDDKSLPEANREAILAWRRPEWRRP